MIDIFFSQEMDEESTSLSSAKRFAVFVDDNHSDGDQKGKIHRQAGAILLKLSVVSLPT